MLLCFADDGLCMDDLGAGHAVARDRESDCRRRGDAGQCVPDGAAELAQRVQIGGDLRHNLAHRRIVAAAFQRIIIAARRAAFGFAVNPLSPIPP